MMTIRAISTEQMVEIVAGLVKNGLTFEATPAPHGEWNIKLTGGY